MMASKIRVLDELTINQIAAGEVIENPASVVKELVENAIDAAADEILIEVLGSGHHLIKVQDNGQGMTQEEALLSLQRHATSKLITFSDLYSLSTLGFRGEALASIAAVSQLTLITCPRVHLDCVLQKATLVQIEGGVLGKCIDIQSVHGTTIEVRSLFYNTPARKKFQKSATRDAQDIVKTVEKIALAFPQVSFKLLVNGVLELAVEKKYENSLYNRVEAIFGKNMMSHMKSVSRSYPGLSVTGFVHDESLSFSNRTKQYLFVNNRSVQSIAISAAVKNGYGPLLEPNRHPAFVLFLTFSDGAIDVNVHPQKKEVRFRDEELVIKVATSCVTNAILPHSKSFEQIGCNQEMINQVACMDQTVQMPLYELNQEKVEAYYDEKSSEQQELPQEESTFCCIGAFREFGLLEMHWQKKILQQGASELQESGIHFMHVRRALSRIAYEQLLYNKAKANHAGESQQLLVPINLDLSTQEAKQLKSMIPYLERLGFSIREFGMTSFLIEALPPLFLQLEIDEIKDLILDAIANDKEIETGEYRARHLAAIATKKYRLPSPLTKEFVKMVTSRLLQCENTFFCPFGKQIFIQLTESEILKRYV